MTIDTTPSPKYDSYPDTLLHVTHVRTTLMQFSNDLMKRGEVHDASKFLPPEKDFWDIHTQNLSGLEFDSPAYKESLRLLKPCLEHHYANNSHHPEHYANGVNGMNIFDIVEMIADWIDAARRNSQTITMAQGIEKCFVRFKIEPQLQDVIRNTYVYLGKITKEEADAGAEKARSDRADLEAAGSTR